ncbi:MAG: MFS family permease, partial [Candidatus Azotimanducaceae bacterium]
NAIVLGGAVGQFPIGWLSDKYDKRSILLSVVTLCIVVVSLIFLTDDKMLFLALCFAFGAVSLPIYVLCVSLANEDSSISRVKVASIILMLNGGGSILGPLLVAFIASYFLNALLIVSGLSMLLLLGASVIFKRPQVEALIIELPTSSFEPVLKQTELAA